MDGKMECLPAELAHRLLWGMAVVGVGKGTPLGAPRWGGGILYLGDKILAPAPVHGL